jgi:hypothetical protein
MISTLKWIAFNRVQQQYPDLQWKGFETVVRAALKGELRKERVGFIPDGWFRFQGEQNDVFVAVEIEDSNALSSEKLWLYLIDRAHNSPRPRSPFPPQITRRVKKVKHNEWDTRPDSEATRTTADNSIKLLRKAFADSGYPHAFLYMSMLQIAADVYSENVRRSEIKPQALKFCVATQRLESHTN